MSRTDHRWSALALIVTAQFMVILDVAIVNVALPSIKTDLNFSQENLQWVISAYAIFFGGVLLLGGRLADLLGRRRLFVAGLVLFSVASLLCGLAWSEASLIGFRALQGLGGAMLAPAALSLLTTMFAEGRERNLALGIYGAASGSGAAVGVLLGGVLTSYLSWSWVFFINVPVGIAAIALTPALLPAGRVNLAHRHFDIRGAATITGGLMLLVYATTRAATHGWGSPGTLGLFGVAAALVGAFVLIELRSSHPLLPLRIFRSRAHRRERRDSVWRRRGDLGCHLLTLLCGRPASRGRVASRSAARLGRRGLNVAQWVVGRFGVRATLTAGLLASALSVAWLTRLPVHGSYFWDLFLPSCSVVRAWVCRSSRRSRGLTGVAPADAGVASGWSARVARSAARSGSPPSARSPRARPAPTQHAFANADRHGLASTMVSRRALRSPGPAARCVDRGHPLRPPVTARGLKRSTPRRRSGMPLTAERRTYERLGVTAAHSVERTYGQKLAISTHLLVCQVHPPMARPA